MQADVLKSLLMGVEDDVVAPTCFIYRLPDPDALEKKRMEQYVDDHPVRRRAHA